VNTTELRAFFDERYAEVEAYLSFLTDLQSAAQSGPPRFEGAPAPITVPQQRILYSSVYLQLYNLVEAAVSQCVEAVTFAATSNGRWQPDDLSRELRAEWVRVTARTHTDLTPQHRLESAVKLCDHLMARLPVPNFTLEIGGGGNWDDDSIEKFGSRLGLRLTLARKTKSDAKRHVRDELGALQLVKNRRNRLAHGSISFVDCADGVTVDELVTLAKVVGRYLREAIESFAIFIDSFAFLSEGRKPIGATG
jgi:hypothetical protein